MHNGSNAGSIGDRSVDQLIAEHISTSEHGSSKDSSKHDGRHYTLDERLMQSTDSRHQLNEETPTLVRRGSARRPLTPTSSTSKTRSASGGTAVFAS